MVEYLFVKRLWIISNYIESAKSSDTFIYKGKLLALCLRDVRRATHEAIWYFFKFNFTIPSTPQSKFAICFIEAVILSLILNCSLFQF